MVSRFFNSLVSHWQSTLERLKSSILVIFMFFFEEKATCHNWAGPVGQAGWLSLMETWQFLLLRILTSILVELVWILSQYNLVGVLALRVDVIWVNCNNSEKPELFIYSFWKGFQYIPAASALTGGGPVGEKSPEFDRHLIVVPYSKQKSQHWERCQIFGILKNNMCIYSIYTGLMIR